MNAIVNMMGGLGNQMFQFSFGKYLEYKFGCRVYYDKRILEDTTPRPNFVLRGYDLDIFNLDVSIASRKELRQVGVYFNYKGGLFNSIKRLINFKFSKVFVEREMYKKHEKIDFDSQSKYFYGYWQNYGYIEPILDLLKEAFTIKDSLISEKAIHLGEIIEKTNSLCINVRRGDFVGSIHDVIGEDYYDKALEKILQKTRKDIHLFVFSDDIDWCINNLKYSIETTYVTHEYAGYKFSNYAFLMQKCKNFIIPNSSFGYWNALLGESKEKVVICPERWLENKEARELIPPEWIMM